MVRSQNADRGIGRQTLLTPAIGGIAQPPGIVP